MSLSVEAGHIVSVDEPMDTLSDGSAGGVEPDAITFDLCRKLVDAWVLIDEAEIRQAIRWIYLKDGTQIEGAAGVALAAALKNPNPGSRDVVIICGGNIDPEMHQEIIRGSGE